MSEGTAVQRLKTLHSALWTNQNIVAERVDNVYCVLWIKQNIVGRMPFLDILFIFPRGIEVLSVPRKVLLLVL